MTRYSPAIEILENGFKKWRDLATTDPAEGGGWKGQKFSIYEANQYYFATEVIGVSQPSWSKWMSGNVRPDWETLTKLAECPFIGQDIYVAYGIPLTVINDPDFQDLARDWRELDRETRIAMINIYRRRRAAPGPSLATQGEPA